MERLLRAIAATQMSLLVLVHAAWILVWQRTGTVPTYNHPQAWSELPMTACSWVYGGSIVLFLVLLYLAPVVLALSLVKGLRLAGPQSIRGSTIAVFLLSLTFWLDPTGALDWYLD